MQKQIFILCRKRILYSAEKSFYTVQTNCFFFFFFEISGSPKKDCYFKKTFEKDFEEKHLKNTFLKKLWKKKNCIIFQGFGFPFKKDFFFKLSLFCQKRQKRKEKIIFKKLSKDIFLEPFLEKTFYLFQKRTFSKKTF